VLVGRQRDLHEREKFLSLAASATLTGGLLGIIYVVLLITVGIISIRKGHWVMFIVGLFIPLFWFIGALLPRRR
jgi:hypothetical protein